jgi:hypothetical protein
LIVATAAGTRRQAGASCGSTRRILTLFHFFHQLRDPTKGRDDMTDDNSDGQDIMKGVSDVIDNALHLKEIGGGMLLEKTMKVIDHKVVAVGEMVQAKNSLAAERSLDRALKAAELLNMELDELIATTQPAK